MSEVFEGYERQYCELSANLSRKCSSAALLDSEEKQKQGVEIRSGIDDAEILIRKMDLEARSLQAGSKVSLLGKLREYKSDLTNLKRELKRAMSTDAREELLESGTAFANLDASNQREMLSFSTERLGKSSDRIKESRRTIIETEELGISILQDLHQQRETLLHSHAKLNGIDDAIDKSKRVLNAMSRRMTRNKWIVGSVIAALVFAIVLILYVKLR